MQVYSGVEALKAPFSGSVVCLGNFDGLHLGHQELIRQTVKSAKDRGLASIVFTFSPHPVRILAPERAFRPLFSRTDLAEQLEKYGVDAVIFQTFNAVFASQSAERFMSDYLERPLHPKLIFVGPDFAFGRGRSGRVADLDRRGQAQGYQVEVLPPILKNGQVVSSSRIRQAVSEGDLVTACELLGRSFYVEGKVESGAGRGQGLGFPTANFTPNDVLTPKRGVYITRVLVDGVAYPSVTNVGGAPTFGDQPSDSRLETHILDQNLALKDVQIRVEFISYLREERRFDSAESLVRQIQADVLAARTYWQSRK